ncbi:TonB-dependent receptor domain-containing protein [Flavobacterium okayamense]|uniref:TonB-dependent receptor n=1 Tax=Flavobacterium okayamense TaxID=2830782 RepID=A0ABN6HXS6_9FLAO|nr:TonB-dependent receptor [Flavobacterium okayamense]BCY29209.1 TonB-dependent receptor [Flavobacterium okayamense]
MSKRIKFSIFYLLIVSTFSYSQYKPETKQVSITGKILEKGTDLPLEYATVVFEDIKTKQLTGGVTDFDGNFKFTVKDGNYNIRFEYISFKSVELKNQTISSNKNFGTIYLEPDIAQLSGVELVGEKSTVEIKLDKRVYNVGSDMTVRGGTAGDVLNNVPSVTVDPDGTIALRGNESVTILIDGKPSGLAGINPSDIIKMLPADAIDKVEVITNPSARYNAEGGGGIINIVMKKGKTNGLNGSLVASVGDPETYGFNSSINYKTDTFNVFSNFGYNYRTNKGEAEFQSTYFDNDTPEIDDITGFMNESRTTKDIDRGYNANFGVDLNLTESLTWTNSLTFRENSEKNPQDVLMDYYDENGVFTQTRNRFSDQNEEDYVIEYATNVTKKFEKEDHIFTADFSVSKNQRDETSDITDVILNSSNPAQFENTLNNNTRNRMLAKTDYVLPLGKDGRFEAGYRGDFSNTLTDFQVNPNTAYSNLLEYVENINALYLQYGNKINKFSYFLGLRWEDSHIEVNSFTSSDFNTKLYNNFFPTATFNYEFTEDQSITLSYSKRINRPRGRFVNPFSTYSSNVNLFQGNPDLDPTFTNVIELGYLWKGKKFTLNSSIYTNLTDDSFQFIRRETGDEVDGVPVIVSTPINLSKEVRTGFEFNVNYSPYKWWRLNTNLNLFSVVTRGDYTYTDFQNQLVTQNFDNDAFTWFARLNNKITLPYKVDWQTNVFYRGPQKNAQGKSLSMTNVSMALSKDVLKDKMTLALNVNNMFNTMKRRNETYIEDVTSSYSEFMWRKRTILFSLTYRFNRKKEADRGRREGGDDDGGDIMG